MSPARRSQAPGTATAIRFIGPADTHLQGIPQGEPELDADQKPIPGTRRAIAIGSDITLAQAHEAMTSGLYETIGGALEELPATTEDGAIAPVEG